MKMKKIGIVISIFEFSISKLGGMAIFMTIWEKTFFEIFTWEGHTSTEVSKGY